MRRTIETLAAGCAVYVLVAACSGAGGASRPDQQAAAGMPSSGGHDGQGGVSAGGEPADAGMAGLLDPVAGASAQPAGGAPGGVCDCPEPYEPPAPVVVEAECDVQVSGTPTLFAVAEFPGRTMEELAGLVAQVTYPADLYAWGDGFETTMVTPFVRDGAAAAGCGTVGSPGTHAERVVFILR